MFSRTQIVEKNFLNKLGSGRLPDVIIQADDLPPKWKLVELFESQLTSRLLDFKSRSLKANSESFYTIGSSGHEGNAVLGEVCDLEDMAFLHYRSAALMIQRSKKLPGQTIIYDLLLSFAASAEDPISGGRHKVLGSKSLFIPPQTSTIASHLPKAVGAALSIDRASALGVEAVMPKSSIVLCNFGDASLNHSTSQGAINCAIWVAYQNVSMPIVFVCEDNGLGISTATPANWVKATQSNRHGIKYFYADGTNLVDAYAVSKRAVEYSRKYRKPSFLHIKTTRLMGHAGSDIESLYLSKSELEENEARDPLLFSARIMLDTQTLGISEILGLYNRLKSQIDRVGDICIKRPKLTSAEEVMESIFPIKRNQKGTKEVSDLLRQNTFGKDYELLKNPWPMNKLINFALVDLMLEYPQSLVFGEDVAKKGGVYHVTAGLQKKFGGRRVFNSLLDEQSILGTAIGLAHNDLLPICEIQFLAYLHNAEDQIRGEAATLSFFSKGQFGNGMVVRIPSLGYQKGFGGHFHNDNSLSVLRDLPGVIIACPSNGADAVKMLRRAFYEAWYHKRVVIFLEPIALYNARDLLAPKDGLYTFIYPDPDEMADLNCHTSYGNGGEIAIVTYGNGVKLCQMAMDSLSSPLKAGAKLFDLKWLSDLEQNDVMDELKGFKKILIVDEGRKSGSYSEELMTLMIEKLNPVPRLKRVHGKDCFIPLGTAAEFVLPSAEEIAETIKTFLEEK
ncbi:MAG: MFS transporter [Bacteriovoracaceae bacterium]|jgi:2-oxoisovalerate dehydrogenase E1 component|nr:MFS transporter [Bacteriovoracaceae bacterium]